MKSWLWPNQQKPKRRVFTCVYDYCERPAEPPDGPFCPDHSWHDVKLLNLQREQQAAHGADLVRIMEAAGDLSKQASYKLAQEEGSKTPCPYRDCRLTVEEHHRLAYGYLNENSQLRARVRELEGGS